MRDSKFAMRWAIGVLLVIFSAIGLKTGLVWAGAVPFNADEAIVALMARHILQGQRPLFFYGQAYMGSLDAWLVSGGFWLLGEKIWVIRLIQGILYIFTLLTTIWIGKKVFDFKTGLLAACLLAIPTVNLTLYTTASLGGYGEALLIGNLILLVSIDITQRMKYVERSVVWSWFGWGFLVGLGLWVFGLTLAYSLPAGIYLAWALMSQRNDPGINQQSKKYLWLVPVSLIGFILGSTPWWIYALENGLWQLVLELSGGAIAGVEGLSYLSQVGQHTVNLLLLGSTVVLGMRPPWGVEWLGLPLLPFILLIWMLVVLFVIRQFRGGNTYKPEKALLLGVMGAVGIGFIFTPFGADPTGRYFLPVAIPLALFAAAMVVDRVARNGKWAWGITALLLIYNLWGTLQSAIQNPPGITTQFNADTQIDSSEYQNLAEFLHSKGETRGYTNYWVAYPLAFLSGEEMVFIPRLPYHQDFRYTERDDRYPAYDALLEDADRTAYITTHHPGLDDYLRSAFTDINVGWQEDRIGDFQIFYGLTRPVRPFEINLGETTP